MTVRIVCGVLLFVVICWGAFEVHDRNSLSKGPKIHELEFTLQCVTPSLTKDRDSTVMLLPKNTFFLGENEYRVMEAFSNDSALYAISKDTDVNQPVRIVAELIEDKKVIVLARIHELEFL